MSTQTIEIKPNTPRTPTQPAKFVPKNATANDGDTITWFNSDTKAHWPAPSVENKTLWFPSEIPAGASSDTLALGPNNSDPNQPYTLNYVCAHHPKETGKITVNPAL